MRCDVVRLGLVFGVAWLGGCSRTPYAVAPVTGVVTLDGQPLGGGVVSFQPVASRGSVAGPGSTGRIDVDGRYRLTTVDGASGAVVGQHVVRIYSRSPESAPVRDSDSEATPKERVPLRFNYGSELRFAVPASGSNDADFRLTTTSGT